MGKIKETDLFFPVKEWLEEHGYDVYSEIENDYNWGRADVVGVCGPIVAVVQLKSALSVNVIGQAIGWLPYANLVYVGVPRGKNGVNPHAAKILKHFGVGIFQVACYRVLGKDYWNCAEYAKAKFNRHAVTDWKDKLTEEYKNNPPGGHAGGGYLTRYRLMMNNVRKFVEEQTSDGRWLTIEQILEHCWTYYRHPKQALARALLKIEKDWCEVGKVNGKLVFRVTQR